MFAIFQLRQPDVLATGDLGLQKGLLRWVLASHGASDLSISPKKLKQVPNPEDAAPDVAEASQSQSQSQVELPGAEDASVLPPVPNQSQVMNDEREASQIEINVAPGVEVNSQAETSQRQVTPEATPIVAETGATPLNSQSQKTPRTPKTPKSPKKKAAAAASPGVPPIPLVAQAPVELPPGMTVATLKARLDGKKVK